jgi:hypothetical protein
MSSARRALPAQTGQPPYDIGVELVRHRLDGEASRAFRVACRVSLARLRHGCLRVARRLDRAEVFTALADHAYPPSDFLGFTQSRFHRPNYSG